MKSRIRAMRIASAVFALVCLAQLFRLVFQIEVVAGGQRIPFWPSAVAFVITGSLSLWLWKLSLAETK